MSGRLILMGSGELAPGMVSVHREGIAAAGADRVVVVDSPFGFQENVAQLTERIRDHFATSLGRQTVVARYRRPSEGEAVRETFRAVLGEARYVFAGPGSPSYALARWEEAGCGPILRRLLREGATVTLASAAALTAGVATIPVYEIYKVGQDPFWLDGLDLTRPFGFSLAVVPHWNNREGRDHDTSHCYIGTTRFERLRAELAVGVMGIDEHTAAILDLEQGTVEVAGAGGVTVEGEGQARLEAGDSLTLDRLAGLLGTSLRSEVQSSEPAPPPDLDDAFASRRPDRILDGLLALEAAAATDDVARAHLRTAIARTIEHARNGLADPHQVVGAFVEHLLELRAEARDTRDFSKADTIRDRLLAAGVEIHDTAEGTTWKLAP
jgi:hypothetical protein